MKKAFVLIGLLALWSCSEDVELSGQGEFDGYENWPLVSESTTGALIQLGQAHTNRPRKIYVKGGLNQPTNAVLPIGTLIVKDIDNGFQIKAMAKRANGWEYLDLKGRSTLGNQNFCNDCHREARTDFVFHLEL